MSEAIAFQIVRADVDDLDAVMTVMEEAFNPKYGEAWTASQCRGILTLPGSWLLLVHVANSPAGFALVRSVMDEAELLLIAIHPQFQRRKIGEALISRVIEDCRRAQINVVHLEVRADNSALGFYERVGFEQSGIRKNYYRSVLGRLTDAVSLNLSLVRQKSG